MSPTTTIFKGSTVNVRLDEIGTGAVDVIDKVNEIVGYDVLASEAEGYAETAEQCLALSESNLAASAETLPPE